MRRSIVLGTILAASAAFSAACSNDSTPAVKTATPAPSPTATATATPTGSPTGSPVNTDPKGKATPGDVKGVDPVKNDTNVDKKTDAKPTAKTGETTTDKERDHK